MNLADIEADFADRLIGEIRTAAPVRPEAAATAPDCKESKANDNRNEGPDDVAPREGLGPQASGGAVMSTISGAHEEVSIYGTGVAHIPLVGKPEFAGLDFDAGGVATATVKDGALGLAIDDIDLLIAWRDAFQHAIAAMVIRRQRQEGRS